MQKPGDTAQDTRLAAAFEIGSTRSTGDLAWLGQALNGSDAMDQQQKDVAIQAVEALFAQYGQ